MQPTYESEDYLSRGFLGSMFGLAGRKRASSKTDNASKQQPAPPTVVSTPTVPITVTGSRTEADIYREIVTEARYLERSQTTTPDFSSPTSPVPAALHPQHYYIPPAAVFIPPDSMMHHDAQKIYPPYHMVMTSTAPHPIPVDQNGVPLGNQCPMAPPPYFPHQPSSSTTPSTPAEIPYEVKREIQEHLVQSGNSQVSIEDIVKMVVTALKDSNIDESSSPAVKDESPEEILRRKRVQNNLAAARYRKRQREARDVASQELGDLARRNEDLRSTVARMESEIAQLKRLVLDRP